MDTRFEYIDNMKGIGIILVVIGHCLAPISIPRVTISSFHMPLFFFLAGYCFLFERNPIFVDFLNKRLRQLIVPTFVFTLIISLLSVCFINNYELSSLKAKLPGALWFLPVLFLAEILFYLLYKVCEKIIFQFRFGDMLVKKVRWGG